MMVFRKHLHQDYRHPSYPGVTMKVLSVRLVFLSKNFSKNGLELPVPLLLPGKA